MARRQPVLEPRQLARRARLRYTSDDQPGIRRVGRPGRFAYRTAGGSPVRGPNLQRIRGLVIPPAWTQVWICPHPHGHLQATGRDARGRKQYLYHASWQEQANRVKFSKLRAFGEALPDLRRSVARHVALPALTKTKVAAAVVELLDQTLVRVGNEEYARTNESFGLTTLRDRHVRIRGPELRLRFHGKSGILHEVGLRDRRLARIVKQCQELPGQQLLQYRTERGRYRRLESADVNRYLRQVTGLQVTAKDFRTWKATALVLEVLLEHAADSLTAAEARRDLGQAIRQAATTLGNTITVCRKYYIHPQITELFLQGKLAAACGRVPVRARNRLGPIEQVLLRLLRRSGK
jgi:DNA topoisomerase-1